MRALRVHDENAPPQLPGGKTIHQRNKSTPVLSTLAQNGGVKAAAAKRTAFADVSNTRQPVAKDDMQVSGKVSELLVVNDRVNVSSKDAGKPTSLLRPAQRPVAGTNAKPLQPISNNVVSGVPKGGVGEPGTQAANSRKVLSKKATTIFKEDAGLEVVDAVQRHIYTASATVVPQQVPSESEIAEAAILDLAIKTALPKKVTAPADDGTNHPAVPTHTGHLTELECVSNHVNQESYEYLDALEEQARVLEQDRNDELAKSHATIVSDVEEYWDEDEDEEYYDADGYTTARSLRSRGDTTGGVTMALAAPRITSKTQRELEEAKQWVEAHRAPEDIEDEQWDTSMVAEYGEEIFEYMHSLEVSNCSTPFISKSNNPQERMKPNPTYMDHQAEIQWSMRSVLMDWLVQVHHRFTLLPETLFLSVNYVDRFLSSKVVSLGKLQLVGATALFVAAKYEEINCPSVQEIVYMVDGAYTVDEILKAERFMLSMLQFELGWPGPMSFLRRISKADDYDLETRTLAKYFLEITLMDERFVGCVPSFIAAGAHCLARFMLKKGDWVS